MHHVAIMNKSWKLIPKILSGEKTIESRWYQTRRSPWDSISAGDTIFFKNSGEDVTASASVSHVLQFSIRDANDAVSIIRKYGKNICLVNKDPRAWERMPKYCILIFLEHPKQMQPFSIDKRGYGIASAWIAISNIRMIKSK